MNIIIAAGGTGGHLFPGIAIAQEFLKRSPENNIAFMGSKKGIESRILPELKFRLKTITVKGFKGKRMLDKVISIFSIPVAFMQAGYCLKRFHTDIVVGLGGYTSFPAIVSGVAMRIPTVIHEQNSIPGLSNRILGGFVNRVFISYEESKKFFKPDKTIFSGMPIRDQLLKETGGKRDEPFCIFVLGGSQGAREINQAVIAALPFLTGMGKIRFIHQAGGMDIDMLEKNYKKFGFSAQVFPFIEDMFTCYREAHLVISRAGASTLAELALCSKAAILIPYPFAASNHQEKNARVFVDNGAALMIHSKELSGKTLSSLIMDLEKDRGKLQQMENQVRTLSRPKAAETIVDECYRLVAQTGGGNALRSEEQV